MLATLLLFIFLRPFIASPAYPYANLLLCSLVIVLTFLWLLPRLKSLSALKTIAWPLVFFASAIAVSIIFSINKTFALIEIYKYLCVIMLFFFGLSLSQDEESKVLLCIWASGILIALLAVYQYFFGFRHLLDYMAKQGISDPFTIDYISRKRVFFPFVTPNTLGAFLALLLPLAMLHKFRILPILLLAYVLLLTRSLGSCLSLAAVMLAYLFWKKKERKGKLLLTGFGVLAALILVFALRTVGQREHTQPLYSLTARLDYWWQTIKLIRLFPFTGIGIGNFNLMQSRYAHNAYLQIWAETGIFGFLSFFWLIATILVPAIKKIGEIPARSMLDITLLAALAFLSANMVDFSLYLPETASYFWLIMGIVLKNTYRQDHSLS